MNEYDKELIVESEREVYTLVDYFDDHPIMLIGFGMAGLVLGVCKVIDNKYNKEEI